MNTEPISLMSPREHIRKRPGMYIGGTDERALHHLIYETVDNAVDEYFAGHCDHIWITLRADNEISIRDNGMGIPVYSIEPGGQSWLEFFMTTVGLYHSPQYREQFGRKPYSVAGGLHGVGLAAVAALSEALIVEVARDGYLWRQAYKEGLPQGDVAQIRELAARESTGTTITIKPDYSIFDRHDFSAERIDQRSRELACLLKRLKITFRDERIHLPSEVSYHFPGGLVDYIRELNPQHSALHSPVSGSYMATITPENKEAYDIIFDFAFQYTDNSTTDERSYINTVRTHNGGTHATALRDAIVSVMKKRVASKIHPSPKPKAIMAGVMAVVSVQHPQPHFMSPTKTELTNPEVYNLVFKQVVKQFSIFLDQNPDLSNRLLQKLDR